MELKMCFRTRSQLGSLDCLVNHDMLKGPLCWDESKTRSRCLPHSGKNFLMHSELLTCFACFYVGIEVPYVINYDSVKLSEHRTVSTRSMNGASIFR